MTFENGASRLRRIAVISVFVSVPVLLVVLPAAQLISYGLTGSGPCWPREEAKYITLPELAAISGAVLIPVWLAITAIVSFFAKRRLGLPVRLFRISLCAGTASLAILWLDPSSGVVPGGALRGEWLHLLSGNCSRS